MEPRRISLTSTPTSVPPVDPQIGHAATAAVHAAIEAQTQLIWEAAYRQGWSDATAAASDQVLAGLNPDPTEE